jgi:hypothetical protein
MLWVSTYYGRSRRSRRQASKVDKESPLGRVQWVCGVLESVCAASLS